MRIVEQWGESLGVPFVGDRFHSKYARVHYSGNQIILLCPLTFMNLSGESVRDCLHHYDVALDRLLVIHDDLDLPLGRIKVVKSGGAGGHKGVSSIIACLDSSAFSRVKIGIGRPSHGESITDYVLTAFYDEERELAKEVIRNALKATELFVLEGVETAMNRVNCRRLTT
jgi:PTH1 family peptidyl-tRNA hydrolase